MYKSLTQKKAALDDFRPLPPELVSNLDDWFRVELTYSSNAIEGNTLTRRETALVVQKGLTVSGKSLSEHLEAHNHAKALDFVRGVAERTTDSVNESDILRLHGLILQGIDDQNAGCYRCVPVRISGSMVVLPNHMKVQRLMTDFVEQVLANPQELHPVEIATQAHYELVTIHPFADGNGRTARLLMNLALMQHGYPPAIIAMRQRERYISSLELLRIGELAKLTGQTVPTIRYWTQRGLLQVANRTDSGYTLYEKSQVERAAQVVDMKAQRLSLAEIKNRIQSE